MNILHLSPYIPSVNTYHAGGVHMGKQIELLSENNDVFVMSCFNDEKERKIIDEQILPHYYYKNNKLLSVVHVLCHLNLPNMFAMRTSLRFALKLIYYVKKYNIDAIQAEYTSMGQYVWIKRFFPHIMFNLVEHDVVQQSYSRHYQSAVGIKKLYYKWQLGLVIKKESKYCNKADNIFVLNNKDKILIDQYYGCKDNVIELVPYYGLESDFTASVKEDNTICFIGQMGRKENKNAAMRLIGIIKKMNRSDIKLYIIGANPDDELQAQSNDQIIVTGFVQDINSVIKKCKIAVFPLMEGAGIKFKVLLAIGLGLPVITTDIGAEGIDEKGETILIANDDETIINKICELLDDESLYEKKVNESKLLIDNKFNMDITRDIIKKIYA
jgi:glycosyltransferase involved in cell wall biosynthesis